METTGMVSGTLQHGADMVMAHWVPFRLHLSPPIPSLHPFVHLEVGVCCVCQVLVCESPILSEVEHLT